MEPRQSGDLKEASVGLGAATPAAASDIDLVLPKAASDRVAPRSPADASARIERSAPATGSVERRGIKTPFDWPGIEPRATTAPSSAIDAGVVVAPVEPRRSDDFREAPLRRSAALLTPAGTADIVLSASQAPMQGLAPTLVGLPAQNPVASDAPARSVTSEVAIKFAMVTPATATPVEAGGRRGRWDGAVVQPDPASTAVDLVKIATDTRPLLFDPAADRGPPASPPTVTRLVLSEEAALVSPVSIGMRIDEGEAPEKPANDDVASIFPASLIFKHTTAMPALATIPTVRPSAAELLANRVEDSQSAETAAGSLAIGTVDAAWSPWGVQLASSFSLDQALASFASVQRALREAATEPPLLVRKVNRSRGWAPLYQILIPAADQKTAIAICRRLEAAKGACMVVRN
jgi:hypothetical protein